MAQAWPHAAAAAAPAGKLLLGQHAAEFSGMARHVSDLPLLTTLVCNLAHASFSCIHHGTISCEMVIHAGERQ